VEILSVVSEIQRSGDSQVERIVIAGFASPEGSANLNMRLSERRGESVRKFILDNSSLRPSGVSVYAGGEDWEGLREMVASSDMWDKHEVLYIIDNYPVWGPEGGRESKLMRLRGGAAYRHMYRNFFPELREAAYITIYYKNK
jgi:pimeloyl-ACP methyl ester carboxylesterase